MPYASANLMNPIARGGKVLIRDNSSVRLQSTVCIGKEVP